MRVGDPWEQNKIAQLIAKDRKRKLGSTSTTVMEIPPPPKFERSKTLMMRSRYCLGLFEHAEKS